ncbi:hypothetical protein MATL_G00259990 [Megalops atlanticus]|uniref:Solute carrier family 15 member 5 n=1 Tax=Megalops atlanticus TaxID=7932 RepID=A0A9D3PAZ9_MEGAT|nr:hypothetical protein MATL_G00259990 [Megalops atlanticus]
MLPVVAFPFEDFYIDTHHIMHMLDRREQQILFYTGLLAAALGIGGIRAILCPLGAYSLQGYDQHQLLSFFNWFYWLVNLNSTVVFLGIAYIQQSVAKNLGFLIPFTSVLLALIAIHMVRNNLIFRPKKGGSLLTTLGVFLNSLKMCCMRYRHLSGDVTSWLDRAKENNGGRYSEAHVENVKVLARLFPLFALQLLYRACVTQIPSGYYIQTMNSNLNLNGFLLPIAAMNVISILPLLALAPLLQCAAACSLSLQRSPLSPTTLIVAGHTCAALSVLAAGLSEIHRKGYPLVEQALSGKVLRVSSMACFQLTPQYILLGMAEALVTPACSLLSYRLAPGSVRAISLHFLTLSYGGGCFLGALIIQLVYLLSGGRSRAACQSALKVTACERSPFSRQKVEQHRVSQLPCSGDACLQASDVSHSLSDGNLERFFFLLATLMAVNTLVFWKISYRYTDLSVELGHGVKSQLAEKLLQHKKCLRFYDTVERSYTLASMETVL